MPHFKMESVTSGVPEFWHWLLFGSVVLRFKDQTQLSTRQVELVCFSKHFNNIQHIINVKIEEPA